MKLSKSEISALSVGEMGIVAPMPQGQKKEVKIMTIGKFNNKRSILAPALVVGAIAGGAALLMTPKSGKEIRKDLNRFSADAREQVVGVVAKAVKTGREAFDEGTTMIADLLPTKKTSFVTPLILGSIAGAGIALVAAKKSGKEVREDIKRMAVSAWETFVTVIDKSKTLFQRGKNAIPEAVAAGKKAYIHGLEKFRHAA
jgi:gas vesicle protein